MIRLALSLASLGCLVPLLADAQAAPAPVAPATPSSTPNPPAPHVTAVGRDDGHKRGDLTFELNLGGGRLRSSYFGDLHEEGTGGMAAIGIGAWLTNDLAIMARASVIRYSSEDGYGYTYDPVNVRKTFYGVSAQYWVNDYVWGSAGIGAGQVTVSTDNKQLGFPIESPGLGLDLRIGATPVSWTSGSLNVSFAVTPLWTNGDDDLENDSSWMGLSTAFLVGYQFL